MGEILLDGISFHHGDARETFDEFGSSWYATDVTGIRGVPASRIVHTNRPGSHGSYRGDAFRDTRAIGIDGTIAALTPQDLRRSEERLTAICADPTKLYELHYTDEYASRFMYVEHSGSVDIIPKTRYTSTFSMSLIAPDPMKYGPWVSGVAAPATPGSGGVDASGLGVVATGGGVDSGTSTTYPRVTVSNDGTAPGILVAEFIGPATDPIFLNDYDGRSVKFRGDLAAGESLWVNLSGSNAHEIPGMPVGTYLEGRGMYGPSGYYGGGAITVTNGSYPDFPAGGVSSYLFVNGQGNVHARPAYW